MKLFGESKISLLLINAAFLAIFNIFSIIEAVPAAASSLSSSSTDSAQKVAKSDKNGDFEMLFNQTASLDSPTSKFLTSLNSEASITADTVFAYSIGAMQGYFGEDKEFMIQLKTAHMTLKQGEFGIVNQLANLTASISLIYQVAMKHSQQIPEDHKTKMASAATTYKTIPLYRGMHVHLPAAPTATTQEAAYGKNMFASVTTNFMKLLVTQGVAMLDHCEWNQKIGWVATPPPTSSEESSTSTDGTTQIEKSTISYTGWITFPRLEDKTIKIYKEEFDKCVISFAQWTTQKLDNASDATVWEIMQHQQETFIPFRNAMGELSDHGCNYNDDRSGFRHVVQIHSDFTQFLSNATHYLPAKPSSVSTCSKTPSATSIVGKLNAFVQALSLLEEEKKKKEEEEAAGGAADDYFQADSRDPQEILYFDFVEAFIPRITYELTKILSENGPNLDKENDKCAVHWTVVDRAMGIISDSYEVFTLGLNRTKSINWGDDKYSTIKISYEDLKTEYETISYTSGMTSKLMAYPSDKTKTDVPELAYMRNLVSAVQYFRQFLNSVETVKTYLSYSQQTSFPTVPTKLDEFKSEDSAWNSKVADCTNREAWRENVLKLREILSEINDENGQQGYMEKVIDYARTSGVRMAYYDFVKTSRNSLTRFMHSIISLEDLEKESKDKSS